MTDEPEPSAHTRLWGGRRFATGAAAPLAALSVSVHFDWRLAPYDLRASKAHARVLHRAGLLDRRRGRPGCWPRLDQLTAAVATGDFRPTVADEDVHTALERGLLERLGTLGGKLRAGRSRNDQVATDLRLYLRDHARQLVLAVAELRDRPDQRRRTAPRVAMPGMTHLQHAQPVLLAHHLLAHVHALARDVDRLRDWDRRAAICPLGSGRPGRLVAAARPGRPSPRSSGSTHRPPTRSTPSSDRDFAAEFLFAAALLGVHLSRLGEEIILWATPEFGWVELDDA